MKRRSRGTLDHKNSQYSLVNSNELTIRLICCICGQILIQPTQTECGCRFCSKCITDYFDDGGSECPGCQDKNIDKNRLIRDRAIEREISVLLVACNNDGCKRTMILKEVNNHFKICEFRQEQCERCQKMYQLKFNKEHLDMECMKGQTQCSDCGLEMTREDLSNKHRNYEDNIDDICKKWNSMCPYHCGNKEETNVFTHLQECSNKPRECLMKQLGCKQKGTIEFIKSHMENDSGQHQILMMKEINYLRSENHTMKAIMEENEKKLMADIQETAQTKSDYVNQISILNERIKDLEKNIQYLLKEIDGYKNVAGSLSYQDREIVIGRDHVVWTISNIREKIQNGKVKPKFQIVSANFYITRPGYNMTLKVYPNGDGNAKDKYLSAYFVINKGEYDDAISWPFRSKVTISLLNRIDSSKNVTVHMRPDNNTACYGRPVNSFNVGAGQPEFVKLSEILGNDGYLHDGAVKLLLSVANDRPFSTI